MLYSDGDLERIESGNTLLFIGMGLVGIGLVTMVVGLGEKGFKTVGLMMLGPSLVTFGLLLVVFRVLLCTVGMGQERKLKLDDGNYCNQGGKKKGQQNNHLVLKINKRNCLGCVINEHLFCFNFL